MAHYGIQAQVAAKTASKRSPGVEKAILEWICEGKYFYLSPSLSSTHTHTLIHS